MKKEYSVETKNGSVPVVAQILTIQLSDSSPDMYTCVWRMFLPRQMLSGDLMPDLVSNQEFLGEKLTPVWGYMIDSIVVDWKARYRNQSTMPCDSVPSALELAVASADAAVYQLRAIVGPPKKEEPEETNALCKSTDRIMSEIMKARLSSVGWAEEVTQPIRIAVVCELAKYAEPFIAKAKLEQSLVDKLDPLWGPDEDDLIDINVEEPEDYLLVLDELIDRARASADWKKAYNQLLETLSSVLKKNKELSP